MSLKNKYLLKKLLKWVNKKQNNFNIYNAALKKKKRKTPGVILLHLCTKHLDDMIYSSWDIKRDRLKLENLGHFLPFYHPKNQNNQNFEKMKKMLEKSSFYTWYQKSQSSYDVQFLRYGVRQTVFSFWATFCPFYPTKWNQNFEK